jgi:hypothetical protein
MKIKKINKYLIHLKLMDMRFLTFQSYSHLYSLNLELSFKMKTRCIIKNKWNKCRKVILILWLSSKLLIREEITSKCRGTMNSWDQFKNYHRKKEHRVILIHFMHLMILNHSWSLIQKKRLFLMLNILIYFQCLRIKWWKRLWIISTEKTSI